jgi:hypothetical protein
VLAYYCVGEKRKFESAVASRREVRMLRADDYTTTSTSKKRILYSWDSITSMRHIVNLNRTGFLRSQETEVTPARGVKDKIRCAHRRGMLYTQHPILTITKRMRAVVQRVLSASVTGSTLFSLIVVYALVEECLVSVNSEIVSEISRGLMVLVGIGVGKCHFNINIRRVVMK